MNCDEIRPLLHACADGELDLLRSLEVENHLKTCAACAAEGKSAQSLRSALRQGDFMYRAPQSLRQKIRRAIRAADGESQSREISTWFWKLLAGGATAFAVLTLFLRPMGVPGHDELLAEAVSGHVRSLMGGHLTDVASTDQHTVKPWFDGKVDFAPDVKDFAAQGFPLVGGRLDYLNGRNVAALVYRHDKHFINVFVWPIAGTNETGEKIEKLRGYSIINRDVGGLHYCLVSDLNQKDLSKLAGLIGK